MEADNMALQNHFRPPLSVTHPWRGFHSTWAATIAKQLNGGVLPSRFYAIPNIDLGGPVEIDVATLEESGIAGALSGDGTALWTPGPAAVVVPVEFPANELVEVQVFYDEGEPRLMASVELVSPANRDRPATRRAFVVKCASYLNSGAAVVIVDVVTDRRANLHAELMQLLNVPAAADWQSPTNLYAVAYRTTTPGDQPQLEIWREPLTLGLPLPCLPLWLGVDLVVPLDLDQSYLTTCHDLRIRLAG
jgi:hypothetical protein